MQEQDFQIAALHDLFGDLCYSGVCSPSGCLVKAGRFAFSLNHSIRKAIFSICLFLEMPWRISVVLRPQSLTTVGVREYILVGAG